MAKKMWVITAPNVPNPLKGKDGKGSSALVHSKADLDRRLEAARAAGEEVSVREVD